MFQWEKTDNRRAYQATCNALGECYVEKIRWKRTQGELDWEYCSLLQHGRGRHPALTSTTSTLLTPLASCHSLSKKTPVFRTFQPHVCSADSDGDSAVCSCILFVLHSIALCYIVFQLLYFQNNYNKVFQLLNLISTFILLNMMCSLPFWICWYYTSSTNFLPEMTKINLSSFFSSDLLLSSW